MNVWKKDNSVNTSWLQKRLPYYLRIFECTVKDISNAHRRGDIPRNGSTLLLIVHGERFEGDPNDSGTFVLKQVPPSGLATSVQLGLAREAIFYDQFARSLRTRESFLPLIEYSYGNMKDGSKLILMEDLSVDFVDSGVLFGPGNPNNWNRDLEKIIATSYPSNVPTSFEVANQTFLAIATVHAKYWRDGDLLTENYNWLRGSSWVNGKDKQSWQASHGMIQKIWEEYTQLEAAATEDGSIQWDPLVRLITEKAMRGISWEDQLKRLNKDSHFCLVHGDFWPGNVMISRDNRDFGKRNSSRMLKILDWEMVGIGSGPQELGQYIISNMDTGDRRKYELQLIRNYFNKLVELNVKDFSWESCWNEYKIGGLERWLWFLVYFCGQNGQEMMKWAQYFHNQIKDFVHDHGIRPEDVTQPRP